MKHLEQNFVHVIQTLAAAAGQRIRIRIKNADGTVATEVAEHDVPAGKSFLGYFVARGSMDQVG